MSKFDKLIAKYEKLAKEEQKAQFAKEVAKQKQKDAVKEKSKPAPTKQERMEAEVKRLETQDKLNKLTGRGKPETGAEAVDRLLEALKKQNQLMYNTDGSPAFSGKMEEKTTMSRRRSIPIPGTERVIPIPGTKEFEVDYTRYGNVQKYCPRTNG